MFVRILSSSESTNKSEVLIRPNDKADLVRFAGKISGVQRCVDNLNSAIRIEKSDLFYGESDKAGGFRRVEQVSK